MLIEDVKKRKYRNILRGLKNNKSVTQACRDEGISPQAFYKWKNATPERRELYEKIKDVMTDKVEMSLYDLCIKEKNFNAIKFWLESSRPEKWKRKAYEPKKGEEQKDNPQELREKIKNSFGLSDEDIAKMEGEM